MVQLNLGRYVEIRIALLSSTPRVDVRAHHCGRNERATTAADHAVDLANRYSASWFRVGSTLYVISVRTRACVVHTAAMTSNRNVVRDEKAVHRPFRDRECSGVNQYMI